MMPISEIKEGDMFANPLFKMSGFGLIWYVEKVNIEEKMVKIQAHNEFTGDPVGRPIWKKSSDRMFCEQWRYGVTLNNIKEAAHDHE